MDGCWARMMTICSIFLNLVVWLYHCVLEAESVTEALCIQKSSKVVCIFTASCTFCIKKNSKEQIEA